jgi:leucyl aminopeptidase
VSPTKDSTTATRNSLVPAAPSVTVTFDSASRVKVDAVIVGLRPGPAGPVPADGSADVDRAFDGGLAVAFATLGATGAAGQVYTLPAPKKIAATLVVTVGLGEPGTAVGAPAESVRRAVGAVVRTLAGTAASVAVSLGGDPATVAAACEGASLGGYVFDRYRTAAPKRAPVGAVTVLAPKRDTAATAAADRARIVATSVNVARDLVNTPPGDLIPSVLADRAAALGRAHGCTVEVLDEAELVAGGYGGIVGVGQGSVNPPRLVQVSYRPRKPAAHLALVGKGITFDTGGLSLKPTAGMLTMKCDMAGAAAVLATTIAVAQLKLPIRVDAWLAIAENMPGGSAQRPSDVVTMRNGTTCEVLNTDAEGRLVMADAIARASEDSPDAIIDVATLTGACVVALGQRTYGVMGNDDDLRERIVAASREAGEPAWPLPLLEESRERIESKVADIAHWVPGPQGGALTAATFLSTYVGAAIPWAHLDIAGPAYNDGPPRGYTPSGGTGSSVRALVRFLETAATKD